MTEERIKEITAQVGIKDWYGREIKAIKAVAAVARAEAIDEMRDAVKKTAPVWYNRYAAEKAIDEIAEQLKGKE